ncbi:MAG: hypothetical protein EKK41_01765 [Hyphomicrobiales bacterium]|nr:MAG: hypothetical protein EKK41_01765 [Hyphomicrobiales bacterium]
MARSNRKAVAPLWLSRVVAGLSAIAVFGMAGSQGACGSGRATTVSARASDLVVFDLPAQPLATAIESYSVLTGWQVIYESGLSSGRQSAPVKGTLAPAEALRLMLVGTRLVPEFMAADGATLIPDPMAAEQSSVGEPAARFRDYYGRIQAGLEREFCTDEILGYGGYRIPIGFWIGASGSVVQSKALGSTGRAEIDVAFDRAVRRLALGRPPPEGFAQPVVILVTPELLAQCRATRLRPAGRAR